MNTDPQFKIGDRVKLRYAYDEATDSSYPTDEGDEGVIYGVAWNNGDRWYREAAWVYWIRLDRHSQPWLPCPFWDPDPIPEECILMASGRGLGLLENTQKKLYLSAYIILCRRLVKICFRTAHR